jgi:hypothetical protein
MQDILERRSEPRTPVSYEARFSAVDTERNSSRGPEAMAIMVDVSSKGFGMLTPFKLERGLLVVMERIGDEQLPGLGVVIWSREVNSHYRIGCVRPRYYE